MRGRACSRTDSGTSARRSSNWCGCSPRTASCSPVTGFSGRQYAELLDAPLAAAQHSQRDDRAAEQGGQAEADLNAEYPLSCPVDVAQVEQQRGLVEGEPDPGAERERERGLESLVVGDEAGRPAVSIACSAVSKTLSAGSRSGERRRASRASSATITFPAVPSATAASPTV